MCACGSCTCVEYSVSPPFSTDIFPCGNLKQGNAYACGRTRIETEIFAIASCVEKRFSHCTLWFTLSYARPQLGLVTDQLDVGFWRRHRVRTVNGKCLVLMNSGSDKVTLFVRLWIVRFVNFLCFHNTCVICLLMRCTFSGVLCISGAPSNHITHALRVSFSHTQYYPSNHFTFTRITPINWFWICSATVSALLRLVHLGRRNDALRIEKWPFCTVLY